jgi:hypothetical protein
MTQPQFHLLYGVHYSYTIFIICNFRTILFFSFFLGGQATAKQNHFFFSFLNLDTSYIFFFDKRSRV